MQRIVAHAKDDPVCVTRGFPTTFSIRKLKARAALPNGFCGTLT